MNNAILQLSAWNLDGNFYYCVTGLRLTGWTASRCYSETESHTALRQCTTHSIICNFKWRALINRFFLPIRTFRRRDFSRSVAICPSPFFMCVNEEELVVLMGNRGENRGKFHEEALKISKIIWGQFITGQSSTCD